MSLFPQIQLDPNIQGRSAFNNAMNSLQSVNEARKSYLDNMAKEAILPYAADKEKADIFLTQQKGAWYPTTAQAGFLKGFAAANNSISPFAPLRGADDLTKSTFIPQILSGATHMGSIPLQDNSGLRAGLAQMANNMFSSMPRAQQATPFSGVQTFGQPSVNAPLGQDAGEQMQSAQLQAQPFTKPRQLPMTPAQQARLQNIDWSTFKEKQPPQQQSLTDTAENRAPDEVTKKLIEQEKIKAENKVASPQLIQKANYAENLLQTFKTLNQQYGYPAITFARYMGPNGKANLAIDFASNSPTYNKYISFLEQLNTAKDQATQFFGASISPEASKHTLQVFNPVNWKNNPASAMISYNTLTDIINKESKTALHTAGRDDKYEDIKVKFDPEDFYQQISANPEYAKEIISVLNKDQKNALKEYHDKLGIRHEKVT